MTDEEFKELIKEIEKASDKFGGFSTDTTFCSIREALLEYFNVNVTTFHMRSEKNGRSLQLEIFA